MRNLLREIVVALLSPAFEAEREKLLTKVNSLLLITNNGDLPSLVAEAQQSVESRESELDTQRELARERIAAAKAEFNRRLDEIQAELDNVEIPAQREIGQAEQALEELATMAQDVASLGSMVNS